MFVCLFVCMPIFCCSHSKQLQSDVIIIMKCCFVSGYSVSEVLSPESGCKGIVFPSPWWDQISDAAKVHEPPHAQQGRSDRGVYRYIYPQKSVYLTDFYVVTGCFGMTS